MKLFYKKGTCALAVHIVLIWSGCEYELEEVEIGSNEFKKINPLGAVPALLDDGIIMMQAASLLKYISNKFPEKQLLGVESIDPHYMQKIDQWLFFLSSDLHPAYVPFFNPSRFSTNTDKDTIENIKKAANNRLQVLYKVLEQHLDGKEYMMGSRKTIVDAYVYVLNSWIKVSELDIKLMPNISKHFNQLSKDPGVIRARKEQGI